MVAVAADAAPLVHSRALARITPCWPLPALRPLAPALPSPGLAVPLPAARIRATLVARRTAPTDTRACVACRRRPLGSLRLLMPQTTPLRRSRSAAGPLRRVLPCCHRYSLPQPPPFAPPTAAVARAGFARSGHGFAVGTGPLLRPLPAAGDAPGLHSPPFCLVYRTTLVAVAADAAPLVHSRGLARITPRWPLPALRPLAPALPSPDLAVPPPVARIRATLVARRTAPTDTRACVARRRRPLGSLRLLLPQTTPLRRSRSATGPLRRALPCCHRYSPPQPPPFAPPTAAVARAGCARSGHGFAVGTGPLLRPLPGPPALGRAPARAASCAR
nr:uncharacterized protein DKFZp434B061-like [Aegilops tauschii subsp. strangulata]